MNGNQMAQLLETSNWIVNLDPALSFGHFFNSVARFSMGQFEAAEKSALEADRSQRGRVPQVQLLLARILGTSALNGGGCATRGRRAPHPERVELGESSLLTVRLLAFLRRVGTP